MLIKLIISFICIGMSLFLMERNADNMILIRNGFVRL